MTFRALGPSTRRAAVIAGCFAALVAGLPLGCGDDTSSADGADAATDALAPADADADSGDAGDGVTPKGARVLGIVLAVGDVDFSKNVQIAGDAGVRSTNLGFGWDDLERPIDAGGGGADAGADADPDAAASAPTSIFNPLVHIANLILPDAHLAATVSVDALDVGGSRAPAALATRPLDDPELASRYDRVTDYILDQTPDLALSALLVGSSVDVPLGDDASQHAAFAAFVTHAAAHAHAARPTLRVGFSVTAEGAVAHPDLLAAAWAASDVVAVRYVPIDAASHVRAPSDVDGDLDRLLAALPPQKPVLLDEAAYPSSETCGSSEAAQADFVTAVFRAWDRHPDRIVSVTFREMADASAGAAARIAARYGHSDAAFLAFLRSLGLRTESRDKPAFGALRREARARGF